MSREALKYDVISQFAVYCFGKYVLPEMEKSSRVFEFDDGLRENIVRNVRGHQLIMKSLGLVVEDEEDEEDEPVVQ